MIGLGAAAVLSCKKDEDPVFAPQEIVLDAAPGAGDTKGFLNTGDLTVNGTSFQTYDYLSGYNGTISGHSNGEVFKYFGNTLTYVSETDKWVFGDPASPTSYRWTRTGTHHFFGWMLADATGGTANLNTANLLGDPSFDEGPRSITASSTIHIGSPQYDFLYSDVVPVDVTKGIPAKVNLPMKHVFGALGIALSNTSDQTVIVNSVELRNFPNNGSVTLNYSAIDSVAVTQNDPVRSNTSYWPANTLRSPITLETGSNVVYDARTGDAVTDQTPLTYYMSWPMSKDAVTPTIIGFDGNSNPIYSSDSPQIAVNCQIGNLPASTVLFRFPTVNDSNDIILPGKRTRLNLQFANKQVVLMFSVLPWQWEEIPMSFEGDAISSTQLKFTDGTFTDGGKVYDEEGTKHVLVKLKSDSDAGPYVATGTFKIYTPVNGILSVTLGGNIDDFSVFLNHGQLTNSTSNSIDINPLTSDGGLVTLVVKAKNVISGRRASLHFSVRNNGRDADADTEINRDNYYIQIP